MELLIKGLDHKYLIKISMENEFFDKLYQSLDIVDDGFKNDDKWRLNLSEKMIMCTVVV